MELKWKLRVPRSPFCRGCDANKSGIPWKCLPCVKAMELAYMEELQRQEELNSSLQQEIATMRVGAVGIQDRLQDKDKELAHLSIELNESESRSRIQDEHHHEVSASLSD
eukprot:750700-Hanusia_phi.AAC.3